jgi:hypothetical protein
MAEIIHDIVKVITTKVMKITNYILISCDEMTSVDNHSWLSLQAYVIDNWSKIPIMVSLQR